MTFNQFFYFCFAASCLLFSCNSQDAANPQTASSGSAQNAESKQEAPPEPMSKKKETLSKLVGEHSLQSISGFMGANTIMDYTLDNGKWTCSFSYLEMGTRVSDDMKLSSKDNKNLLTTKLVVNNDLSISLFANGKEYASFPFKEEMIYSLKKPVKEYYVGIPENLKPNTTFLDDMLYFVANDKMSNQLEKFDVTGISPDMIVVSYDNKNGTFQVQLISSGMSDNSSYIFK